MSQDEDGEPPTLSTTTAMTQAPADGDARGAGGAAAARRRSSSYFRFFTVSRRCGRRAAILLMMLRALLWLPDASALCASFRVIMRRSPIIFGHAVITSLERHSHDCRRPDESVAQSKCSTPVY